MLIKYKTKNSEETQRLGEKLAKEILKLPSRNPPASGATVLGLSGNLGGGKTTFLQGFARGLGVKEKILSPTFVIIKRFQVSDFRFHDFYHIDCYRLKNYKNILELDFGKIIKNPENIVAIEWPERIKKILPKNTTLIKFKFNDKNKREMQVFEKGGFKHHGAKKRPPQRT